MESEAYRKEWKREVRRKLIKSLGDKCARCGNTDYRVLQIDHIYGKGSQDRKNFKNTTSFYRYYLTHPEDLGKLQVLCANCNWLKRVERQEYSRGTEAKYRNSDRV